MGGEIRMAFFGVEKMVGGVSRADPNQGGPEGGLRLVPDCQAQRSGKESFRATCWRESPPYRVRR